MMGDRSTIYQLPSTNYPPSRYALRRTCHLLTLQMERDDYTDRKEYRFSEWRHTLNIINSSNVRVSDLAFRYSGGDGIYVGPAGQPVASMPRQTAAATLTGGRCATAAEVWSLDIKAMEDVVLRLGSTATPILATEATSGLR